MKKIFYLLLLLFSCVSAQAQDVKIYKNGTLVSTYTNGGGINYKIVLSKSNFPGDGKTHEVVDLGLSVKWATCNIGAETAYETGDYFAWGETSTRSDLQWKNYNYAIFSENHNYNSSPYPDDFTKYNSTDGKTILDSEDDAATVNWGSDFRIPTHEEFAELFEKCTWTWDSTNNGYWVAGSNGNSIFLPVTGVRNGTSFSSYSMDDGYYMSSTLRSVIMAYTPCFDLYYGKRYFSPNRINDRFAGYCVRPVTEN